MAQSISQEALAATGLPGATAASRHAGATASGAPATGTFAVGDYVVDQTGAIYICTVSGTPGTWVLTKASNITGTLAVANGGLNATTTAVGSIPLGSSTTAYTPLAIGASGTVLNSNGTTASWLASTGTGNNVLATNPVFTATTSKWMWRWSSLPRWTNMAISTFR